MSKIQAELSEATGVKPKRGEDRADFIAALMIAVAKLSDEDWAALSKPAQNWYNDAADAKNAKKEPEDFPDLEKEAKEEKPTRRRAADADDEPKATTVKVGMQATVLTKRGKTSTGEVVEVDDKMIVLKVDGEELEFDRERLESITVVNDGKGQAADEPEDFKPKVGMEVEVENARGKIFKGEIVELDKDLLVLKTDDGEEELNRDRIKTIKPIGGKKAKEEPEASSRRASAGDDKGSDDGAKKRSSNAEGVSIGTRIKELICDDMEASEADIGKALKKEGIEFKENTLKLNYSDTHKLLDILKANKKLK